MAHRDIENRKSLACVVNINGELINSHLIGIQLKRAYLYDVHPTLEYSVHVAQIDSADGAPMQCRFRYMGKTKCGWFKIIMGDHLNVYPDESCEGAHHFIGLESIIDAGDFFGTNKVEPDALMSYEKETPVSEENDGELEVTLIFRTAEGTSTYTRQIDYDGEMESELKFMAEFKKILAKYKA